MNVSNTLGLVNGATGTIIDIILPPDFRTDCQPRDFIIGTTEDNSNQHRQFPILLVQFDETFYHAPQSFFSNRQRVVPITAKTINFREQGITRKQFPVSLAYASTIHSAQGATCDYVVLSLHGIFERGLAYVGLSRVREFRHLALLDGNFDLEDINNRASSEIQRNMANLLAEMHRLQQLDHNPPHRWNKIPRLILWTSWSELKRAFLKKKTETLHS